MTKKLVSLTAEELAVLDSGYPVSDETVRMTLPRFGMISKDITEKKGKTIEIIQNAGTFYTEKDMGETNEDTGKKMWTKTFVGEEVDAIIAFERKQLRKYDSSLKKFISSAIYDNADQIIPLFLDKQIIKRGTPAELQSMYPALSQKGKATSDLKEETLLYVIYNGELHQMNLSQSSKWAFKDYKKTVNPSKVLTTLTSTEETFGSNTYRKLNFKNKRFINAEELELVMQSQGDLKAKVESDASFFLQNADQKAIAAAQDKELDAYGNEKMA